MSAIKSALRGFIGLFVDDEFLALAILGVVAVAAIGTSYDPDVPMLGQCILLLGCIVVLLVSIWRPVLARGSH